MMTKSSTTLTSTTCPFCLYGCELGIISERGQVSGVEYLEAAKTNHGRLCARGNGAAWVLNDSRRLAEPRMTGKRIDWEKAWTELAAVFKDVNRSEIAITLDKNLTFEERDAILGFARSLRIDTIGSSYLEPEGYFLYTVEGVAGARLADVEAADLCILVGDVFSQMPVLAKSVLDGRYRDRLHRLVVIDCLRTRTGFFADQTLLTRPGTEPLVLLGVLQALAGEGGEKTIEASAQASGVEIGLIRGLATMVNRARSVVIGAGPVAGRADAPYLFSLVPQMLAAAYPDKIKFFGAGEARRMVRGTGFGEILSLVKAKKIKALVNFGESFPFDYPQTEPVLKKLNRLVTTATFIPQKFGSALVLPVPTNLEKSGTIPTLWGEGTITRPVLPASGAKSIDEILHTTGLRLGIDFTPAANGARTVVVEPAEVFNAADDFLLERSKEKRRGAYPLIVVGEKPAIEFHDFFVDGENRLKVNPVLGRSLQLKPGATVMLATPAATVEGIVESSTAVAEDVIACSVNRLDNRRLFEIVIDRTTTDCIIPSAPAKLWKKT